MCAKSLSPVTTHPLVVKRSGTRVRAKFTLLAPKEGTAREAVGHGETLGQKSCLAILFKYWSPRTGFEPSAVPVQRGYSTGLSYKGIKDYTARASLSAARMMFEGIAAGFFRASSTLVVIALSAFCSGVSAKRAARCGAFGAVAAFWVFTTCGGRTGFPAGRASDALRAAIPAWRAGVWDIGVLHVKGVTKSSECSLMLKKVVGLRAN